MVGKQYTRCLDSRLKTFKPFLASKLFILIE